MTVSYREYEPSPLLSPYVDTYWYQSFHNADGIQAPVQRCLPLGMMEIIIHFGDKCFIDFEDKWEQLPDAYFVGIYKDPVRWVPGGESSLLGIRLKPESLLKMFKIPAAKLFNNYVDIESMVGTRMNAFAEKVHEAKHVGEMIRIAENFLLNQLKDIEEERNYLYEATEIIRRHKGNISISKLTQDLYISERQLQRSFKDVFGTSPKTYLRIIRFRNAYEYVQRAENEISWADVSYNFGYADQAHLIRDFKEFAGEVPTIIPKENSFYQMTGQLTY